VLAREIVLFRRYNAGFIPVEIAVLGASACTSRPASSYAVPVLTAEPYFFRLHTNRVFIRRNTTPSLVSVDLSKFSAE
jgi:hypothetical protein